MRPSAGHSERIGESMTEIAHPPAPPSAPLKKSPAWLLWGITAVIIAGTVGVIAYIANRPKPTVAPPEKRLANVAVQEVRTQPYSESLILPARLEADRTAQISCELPGRLQRWLVAESTSVTQGQVLAEMNDDDLRAKLAELEALRQTAGKQIKVSEQDLEVARAALEQARQDANGLKLTLDSSQANLDFAQKESTRIIPLAKAKIATEAEAERVANQLVQAKLGVAKAKDAIKRAAITVRTAQARLGQSDALLALSKVRVQEIERSIASLRITLEKTKIRAPFAGRFEQHLVEAGEVTAPGQLLGRIYDMSYMRAAVDAPDRYAPFLQADSPLLQQYLAKAMPGTRQELKAVVQIPGLPKLTGGRYEGTELPAEIARVAEAANSVSHTFRVELRFVNPGVAFREGMIVRAQINFLTYDEAIVVPLAAIQVADVGPRALVVTKEEDGRHIAHVRDIQPVSIRNDQVLVHSGLKSGEALIIAGGKGVLDGEEVRVIVADGVAVNRTDEGKDSFIQVTPETLAPDDSPQASEPAGGEPAQ